MKRITTILDRQLSLSLVVATLLAAAWLFYSPVIQADITFQDDASRAINNFGNHSFWMHGRFFNEALSIVMSGFSSNPIDYGNLGQILGVGSVVLAVFTLLRFKLDFSARSILATSPLIINPFLLQNLSYQYDSFGMLLGYSLAILAFVFYKNTSARIIASTLLLFASLGLYQAMATMFLMLIALEFIANVVQNKISILESVKLLFYQGATYAAATILYIITTSYIFPIPSGSGTINLDFSGIFDNIDTLTELLKDYFQTPALIATGLAILTSFAALIHYNQKNKSKLMRIIFIAVGTLLLVSTLLGPMVLTKDALIYPRSVPAVILFSLLPGAALLVTRKNYHIAGTVLSALLVVILLQTITFSHTYGSFLKNQSEYRDLLLHSAYGSIQEHGLRGTFYVTGISDSSTVSEKSLAAYPVFNHFWGSSPALNTPAWSKRILKNYGVNVKVDWLHKYPILQDKICSQEGIDPLVEGRSYVIYTVPDTEEPKSEHVIFFRPNSDTTYCE